MTLDKQNIIISVKAEGWLDKQKIISQSNFEGE